MTIPRSIRRRTFLRGLGTAMGLPLLDAMLPRTAARAATAAVASAPRRLAFIYTPNGQNMADWTPAAEGAAFDLPMILQPLASVRDELLIVSGLAHTQANPLGDGGGDHARGSATYLTGCHPRKTAGANIKAGVSVDQIAAARVGEFTRLPSLELTCDSGQRAGSCDSGYSCAYQFNISWRSESMPMNPEASPRAVFDRLFGGPHAEESATARAARRVNRKSVLDFVLEDARDLQATVGGADRDKLDQYFTAVRDVERRMNRSEQFPTPPIPAGVEAPSPAGDHAYAEHVRLMYDMLVLAFQTDSTRVSTFITAHEGSNRPYPVLGIGEGHHDVSHHRNDEGQKAKLARINQYHASLFGYFLKKLRSLPEGEGTLLDNCLIVYGSSISDPNEHLHENLPVLIAGRGGGTITPGRHLRVADQTPMTNLYLSLLDRIDAPADRLGDSTGKLEAIG